MQDDSGLFQLGNSSWKCPIQGAFFCWTFLMAQSTVTFNFSHQLTQTSLVFTINIESTYFFI